MHYQPVNLITVQSSSSSVQSFITDWNGTFGLYANKIMLLFDV